MAARLSPIQINLWQTGVRALFRFYQTKAGITQDESWAGLREELTLCITEWDPPAEEWEFQLVHSILVGKHDCTLEEANAMDERSPDATPVIDALKACIGRVSRES